MYSLLKRNMGADSQGGVERLDSSKGVTPTALASTADSQASKYELLDALFEFLDTEDELNPVLCGYFQKTVTSLYNMRSKEVVEYIY